jgi:tetratricopeptide (TPR) repeat protein
MTYLGWSLDRLGRWDEAIAAYQKAVAAAPRSPGPHTALMGVYYEDRRYRAAIAEGETALRLGEPSIHAHAILCNIYHNVGDLERGEACTLRVLERDPRNLFAQLLLPKFRHEASLR